MLHRRVGDHEVRVGPHFLPVPHMRRPARTVNDALRDRIVSLQHSCCAACGDMLEESPSVDGGRLYDIDHIIPHAALGSCKPHNLMALCLVCHRAKTRTEAALCRGSRKAWRAATRAHREDGGCARLVCFWGHAIISPWFVEAHRCPDGRGPFFIIDEVASVPVMRAVSLLSSDEECGGLHDSLIVRFFAPRLAEAKAREEKERDNPFGVYMYKSRA